MRKRLFLSLIATLLFVFYDADAQEDDTPVGATRWVARTVQRAEVVPLGRPTGSPLLVQDFPEKAETKSLPEAVARVFAKHCYSCHNDVDKEGGLNMQTYGALMEGGKNGRPLTPGNSDESRLLLMVEGLLEPMMPEDDFLPDEEIEVIRQWIDAGAPPWSGDLARLKIGELPDIQPKVQVEPEIASIDFHPSGDLLAAGTYQEVRLIDRKSGKVNSRLKGHVDSVRAVAFSPEGRLIAAAGGVPNRFGEIKVWKTVDGTLHRTLEGHSDCIYAVAFSPDGRFLASSSYDQRIKLWDIESGQEVRTIEAHVDAVYGLSFHPDGKLLISASADRTVKLWNVQTGEQVFRPLNESTAELYTLSVHPSGRYVAAGGEDKMIRIWEIGPQGGRLVRSVFAHDSAVFRLAFTPDGEGLISVGADRIVKLWDVKALHEIKVFERKPDWVLSLDVSPDGKLLALGRYDGQIDFHEVSSNGRF